MVWDNELENVQKESFVLLKCKLHSNSKNTKLAEIFWARLHTLVNGEWDLQNFRGGHRVGEQTLKLFMKTARWGNGLGC